MGSGASIFSSVESLPPGEEDALWKASRLGNAGARSALIGAYLPFARMVAARAFARRIDHELEFDEYLQFGTVGLIEAVDRYDPAAGAGFKTYAGYRINGAILTGLEHSTEKRQQISMHQRLLAERLEGGTLRPEAAGDDLFHQLAQAAIGLALGFMLDNPEGHAYADAVQPETAYGATELHQLRGRIRSLIERLPERERTVIKYHYLHHTLFADIADEMGLTRGRISQLHRSGLERLREMIKAIDACDVAW